MLKKAIALYILIAFSIPNCIGQDSIQHKYYKSFNTTWVAEVPIWIPGLRGELSYGRINTENPEEGDEIDFERVESNSGLKFYFNGSLSKRFNRFWLSIDAFSGKIGSRFSYNASNGENQIEFVDMTVSGTSPRLMTGYAIYQSRQEKTIYFELIPYGGLRYADFRLKSDVFNTSDVIDLNPNWIEPIIGLYIPISYNRFKLELQGDYGWRKSNNSTLSLQARLRYRISRLIDMALGATTVNYKYEDIIEDQLLEFDIRLVGPTLALSFNF